MCFTLEWLRQLFIFLIIVGAVIAILKILIPYALSQIGAEIGAGMNVIIACLRVVLWAVIAIAVVYFCFALISCLMSYSGGMPLFPRGR